MYIIGYIYYLRFLCINFSMQVFIQIIISPTMGMMIAYNIYHTVYTCTYIYVLVCIDVSIGGRKGGVIGLQPAPAHPT